MEAAVLPHRILEGPMRLILSFVALTPLLFPFSALAAGVVQVELVAEGPAAQMASQQWARALDRAGIRSVRIRAARPADQVGVSTRGTPASPLYVVTGVILSASELQMPPGRFRQGDLARLAAWLDDLAQQGTPETREPVGAFGLTKAQLEVVTRELMKPVSFSTRGLARAEAVERVLRLISVPLRMESDSLQALGTDAVADELTGLASGTALACLLRPPGFSLVPSMDGPQVVLRAVRSQAGLEVWPIGFEPDQPLSDVLPTLYEFRDVNIEGVSAQVVIEALTKQLNTPMLLDHNALARHGIDPTEKMVSLPHSRTTYSLALRRILFQAGLKFEVRVDDAGAPLIWITTIKPL